MSILQQLIGYVSLFFIARYMGPEPLGIISSALAFTALFMSFSDLGFGIAHFKKVSEGKDIGSCLGTYAVLKLVLTLTFTLFLVSFILFLSITDKALPVPKEYLNVLIIIIISSVFSNIALIAQNTFIARTEKAKEWFVVLANKLVTSILKTFTAILGLGVVYLAWSNLMGVVISMFIAFWFFRKLPFGKFDYSLFKEYKRYAFPAFIIGLSTSLLQQLDKVFISFLANVEQVGYYTGAKSIVLIITLISGVFFSLLFPSYSKMHSNRDIESIKNLSGKIEKYVSIPLLPVGMFIFFFSSHIQQLLLGSSFSPSSFIIKIMVVSSVLLVLTQPYTAQIMGMNKISIATRLSILILLINIVFYYMLIPENFMGYNMLGLGASGAAFSLLITNFTGTLLFRLYAYKLSGSRPNFVILLYLTCSIIVFALLHWLLKDWHLISNFFVLVLTAFIGGIIYLGILATFGLFKKYDLKFYLDLINPKKMKSYISFEIKE